MANVYDDLIRSYPRLFAQSKGNPLVVPYRGIECGEGWFGILEKLCKGVQAHVDEKNTNQVIFVRVKQKFGGLRIDTIGADDYVYGMLEMARAILSTTCIRCSMPGELDWVKGGWRIVVCPACKVIIDSERDGM